MMMQMYDKMGMGDLIRDPEMFRSQMMAFKEMIESGALGGGGMGTNQLSDDTMDDFDQGEL